MCYKNIEIYICYSRNKTFVNDMEKNKKRINNPREWDW